MKIISACVKYRKAGSTDPYNYVQDTSHCNCYDILCLQDIFVRVRPEKFDAVEGFMLDNDIFVDREEAMVIAKKYNLLKDSYKNTDEVSLKSYMINYD